MAAKDPLKVFEELGFAKRGTSGGEVYGDCIFCGGKSKFYINPEEQTWQCKRASCASTGGNVINYLETFVRSCEQHSGNWSELAQDRGMPVEWLRGFGIVWDGDRWVIPVRNRNGRIITLRFYRVGESNRALGGIDTALYGAEELTSGTASTSSSAMVWLCEGEWDRMALKYLLKQAKKRAAVVAVPGAGTFKTEWARELTGYSVIAAYDHDADGEKGTARAYERLRALVKSFRWVKWPEAIDAKFDVRDFVRLKLGTYADLKALVAEYSPETEDEATPAPEEITASFPELSKGGRIGIEEVLGTYGEFLEMKQDAQDALRIIFAVIMAQQIEGDSLWVHICGPPGGTKTELLMSCSEVANVVFESTVGAHSLVSGWPNGDPSLIPKFIGKTFILKDFTEILDMPAAQRHEIFSIFRGAYDGRVDKDFGNGVGRHYRGHFNMISGVTPAIFRESGASVGERFLISRINQGTASDHTSMVRAAFDMVGKEVGMRAAVAEASKAFLEYRITPADLPQVPEEYGEKLINLAQLVAMLRANVERDFTNERILYRPQPEVGTRLVKQLKKLILALGLQNTPSSIGEEEYRITAKVAVDSCIGWNLDALRELVKIDGLDLNEISEKGGVPRSTLRDRLQDLVLLGVLSKAPSYDGREGRPSNRYYVSTPVRQFWEGAGLSSAEGSKGSKPLPAVKTRARNRLVKTARKVST